MDPPEKANQDAIAFRRDLIKLALDKLLIGGVILGLGLLGSQWLEKFKNREAFVFEINKTRVEKISEIWEKLYVYEPNFQAAIADVGVRPPAIDPFLNDEEVQRQMQEYIDRVSQHEKNLRTVGGNINAAIEAKRFWLTDEEYTHIANYLKAADEYFVALIAKDRKEDVIQKAKKERDKWRATIISTRQKLLNE
jgi:hypothetical protein